MVWLLAKHISGWGQKNVLRILSRLWIFLDRLQIFWHSKDKKSHAYDLEKVGTFIQITPVLWCTSIWSGRLSYLQFTNNASIKTILRISCTVFIKSEIVPYHVCETRDTKQSYRADIVLCHYQITKNWCCQYSERGQQVRYCENVFFLQNIKILCWSQ